MSKVRTTLNIDSELMKTIKLIAVNQNKTQTEVVNYYLKKGIITENENIEKETLKERINRLGLEEKVKMSNEETCTNSNNFKNIIGTTKAPKDFDVVKSIKSIHR
ncbi:MAG: hypothetical protein LBR24_02060 [Methanobrevibacter sp.]|jgi:hypothetical protein|nr:hypothetical protein [Methanobrevibacter sp.]